jgi:rhodanese-related sulfurtransferase
VEDQREKTGFALRIADLASSVLLAVAAVWLCLTLLNLGRNADRRGSGLPAVTARKPIKLGERLGIPATVGQKVRLTVLLGLDVNCGYCRASAPLYRRLAARASLTSGVKLVAVFQQDRDQGETYLRSIGVKGAGVVSAKLGLTGTPTVAVLDSDYRVRDIWVGMLSPSEEKALLGWFERKEESVPERRAASDQKKPGRSADVIVTMGNLLDARALSKRIESDKLVVLDLRTPEEFALAHVARARNATVMQLPDLVDEEPALRGSEVILYCGKVVACQSKGGVSGINPGRCIYALRFLKEQGLEQAFILTEGPEAWQTAGLRVAGTTLPIVGALATAPRDRTRLP